jgi:hypothetical protein
VLLKPRDQLLVAKPFLMRDGQSLKKHKSNDCRSVAIGVLPTAPHARLHLSARLAEEKIPQRAPKSPRKNFTAHAQLPYLLHRLEKFSPRPRAGLGCPPHPNSACSPPPHPAPRSCAQSLCCISLLLCLVPTFHGIPQICSWSSPLVLPALPFYA